MHVNNYFIESLVLCFGCGCNNKAKNGGGGIPDFSNITSCSMEAAQMVIGKQIHWSDQFGTQCDGGGKLKYDLEPIKNIVRLQFVTPPPTACTPGEGTPGQGVAPGFTPLGDGSLPDVSVDMPSLPGIIKGDIEAASTQQDKVNEWFEQHPFGHVFIIIRSGDCADYDWPHRLREVIEENPDRLVPPEDVIHGPVSSLVIIVDWSKYVSADQAKTARYSSFVAQSIIKMIHNLKIPVNRLTLIGCGKSANVAGKVGNMELVTYGSNVYRIIAFNPARPSSSEIQAGHMLNKNDASMVIVIYSDPRGVCCDNGQVNIVVNDPSISQPWCEQYDLRCSSSAAIDIFILSLLDQMFELKSVDGGSSLNGSLMLVPPATEGTFEIVTDYPKVKSPVDDVSLSVEYDNGTHVSTIELFEEQKPSTNDWIRQHPDAHFFILITAEETKDDWQDIVRRLITERPEAVLPQDVTNKNIPIFIINIDWSILVSPVYRVTVNNAHIIAKEVAKIISDLNISPRQVTIIGFGTSAHMAGFIAKELKISTSEIVRRIIAFNPTGIIHSYQTPEIDRLSKNDAELVMVIHSESSVIGYCCSFGSTDIIINSPSHGQPWCHPDDIICSHEASYEIFVLAQILDPIRVINVITGEQLEGFPLQVTVNTTGEYKIITDGFGMPEIRNSSLIIPPDDLPNVGNTPIFVDSGEQVGQGTLGQNWSNSNIIKDWGIKNPHGYVIIIIVGPEKSQTNWPEQLKELIRNNPWSFLPGDEMADINVPLLTIIVDWSEYVYPIDELTDQHARAVAASMRSMIFDSELQPRRITIIAHGISAHLAGFIGKSIQKLSYDILHRIIALNPSGEIYHIMTPEQDRLSKTDAIQVMVIHTETRVYGFCCQIGSLTINVNNPALGQPWCHEKDHLCSHQSSINVLIDALRNPPVRAISITTGEVLVGFPLQASVSSEGVYLIITDDTGDLKPDEQSLGELNVELGELGKKDTKVSVDQIITQLPEFVYQNPMGEIFIIITAEPLTKWAAEMKEALLKAPGPKKIVLIVDWSAYVFPSFDLTSHHSTAVADAVIKLIKNNRIPPNMITIIGFSSSAHVAGLIGTSLSESYGSLGVLVALDPEYPRWGTSELALSQYSAIQVLVIHTNSRYWGILEPIGTCDVYFNGGAMQPNCFGSVQDIHDCSHFMAIIYYIQSFTTNIIAYEAVLQGPLAIRTGDGKVWIGYHPQKQETGVTIFVVETEEDGSIPELPSSPSDKPSNLSEIRANGQRKGDAEIQMPLNKLFDEVQIYVTENPDSDVFIILTEQSMVEWALELKMALLDAEGNRYVLIVDWSKYFSLSNGDPTIYAMAVAEETAKFIIDKKIPTGKITIIGFSTSAHVAGVIGEILLQAGSQLRTIVGLDPANSVSSETRLMLNQSAAVVVQAIHTNTRYWGILPPVGMYDIYPNGGSTQPHCFGTELEINDCSHLAAVKYYIQSILGLFYAYEARLEGIDVIVAGNSTIKFGYPLEHKPGQRVGPYRLDSGANGAIQASMIIPQKQVNSANMDISTGATNGATMNVEITIKASAIVQFPKLNPGGEFFLIITEQPKDEWATELKEELLKAPGPRLVIIVDWSKYAFDSYEATFSYTESVVKEIYEFMKLNEIPLDVLEIIGFGTSAHIAGMIGLLVKSDGKHLYGIIALDPDARYLTYAELSITAHSAVTVQVIHTNNRYWGIAEAIGTCDFYVNGGLMQPQCIRMDKEAADLCSHFLAIDYFKQSIMVRALAHEAVLQGFVAVKTGSASVSFGYQLRPNSQLNIKIFVLETDKNGALIAVTPEGGSSAEFQLPPITSEEENFPHIDLVPPEAENVALDIYYKKGGKLNKVQIQLNGRQTNIGKIIASQISFGDDVYVIVDGEYTDHEEWTENMADLIINRKGGVVIIVTWAKPWSYYSGACHSRAIGIYVANFLIDLNVPFARLHVIGFSVGAHIAGFIGKEIYYRLHIKIYRITGLDPARPMFSHPKVTSDSRLSKMDAIQVDVFHTNIFAYGFTDPIGTLDVYVNGGSIQPGCTDYDHFCSHYRAVLLFVQSISAEVQALEGKYVGRGKISFIQHPAILNVGFLLKGEASGVCYMVTTSNPPYFKDIEEPPPRTEQSEFGPQTHTQTINFPIYTEIFTQPPIEVNPPGPFEVTRVITFPPTVFEIPFNKKK